tara:strand:- start:465 stop:692 length:228 start_codon:yes stop_codon:yes gene_type:complete
MNDKQKIMVMIGLGSIVLFIVSITLLDWSLSGPLLTEVRGLKNGHQYFYDKTNWLGMISLFNMIVSSIGFILFKY